MFDTISRKIDDKLIELVYKNGWSADVYFSEDSLELIDEVRKLYCEFIDNYTKMNEIFGLNSPFDIYVLFNHLLRSGYLSVNHDFKFESPNCVDIYGTNLAGSTILTGEGVCRHLASMLKDILNDMGILSGVVTSCDSHLLLRMTTKLSGNLYGNHAVTFACSDTQAYYLDVLNLVTFGNRKNSNKLISKTRGNSLIRIPGSALYNTPQELELIRKKILGGYIPAKETNENDIVNSYVFNHICMENDDIFDKFYRDNSELYQEVVNIRKKIKRRD